MNNKEKINTLKRVKFSRNTDPLMFKSVIEKIYPDLEYRSGKYFNGNELKGDNVKELLSHLAEDLSNTQLPGKFTGYPSYLNKITKRKKDDKTFREFSSVITSLSGYRKVTISRKTITETKKITDKNIVHKTKKTKMGMINGIVQPVEIEETEEIIPERITEITTKTVIDKVIVENMEENVKNTSLPDYPLAKEIPEFTREQVASYGLTNYVLDKMHDLYSDKVKEHDEKWFSYKKCEGKLREMMESCGGEKRNPIKLSKILIYLIDK